MRGALRVRDDLELHLVRMVMVVVMLAMVVVVMMVGMAMGELEVVIG